MRLDLPVPDAWTRTELAGGRTRFDAGADIRLVVHWQLDLPADQGSWIAAVLRRELCEGFRVLGTERTRSSRGWPVTLVAGQAGSDQFGAAFYRLLHHGAEVVLLAPAADDVAEAAKVMLSGSAWWPSAETASIRSLLGDVRGSLR